MRREALAYARALQIVYGSLSDSGFGRAAGSVCSVRRLGAGAAGAAGRGAAASMGFKRLMGGV